MVLAKGRGVAVLGICAWMLSACGGDGDGGAGTPENPPPAASRSCEELASVALDNARVVDAVSVAAGKFTPPGAAELDVPAFCRVRGVATPTADSLINFELWIPPSGEWNGKFLATGNGGYSPALSWSDMARGLARGYAVVGGDTGHQTGNPNDMLWGVGHPEKITDWGTRSIHAITQAAKPLVAALRGRPASRSYYMGCSTGGHQGYAEVQRYPEDFDGVIAGAPGNNRTALNVGFMWQFLANHAPNDNTRPILTVEKIRLATRTAVAACDGIDGVTDGVIDDPRRCTPDKFNIESLRCTGEDAPGCLTGPQIDAMNKMYAGPSNPRTGSQIYPGWPIGSESGWNAYWGTTEPTRADFWRYWVFDDPKWNWWTFDFDRDLAYAMAKISPLVDHVNPDISAFKARGGKLLVYNGWADPVVNALDTIAYYDKVRAAQGGQAATDEFFRLFLVPGMGHCGGGNGTSTFDALAALDDWVDKGLPPERIEASRVAGGAVDRTRPLCPYPRVARYDGSGSIDHASSFSCVMPD